VLIDMTDGEQRWSCVGAGQNIIRASWLALVDSLEYGLREVRVQPPEEVRSAVKESVPG